MSLLLLSSILEVNLNNPIFRDIMLLLVSFLMILGTLYVYFRLRTSTFRRVRHLLEERVEVKTKQLSEKNLELEKLSLVASKTDNSVIIADDSGKIEWVNDGFMRMTGLSKNIIGKGVHDLHVYENINNIIEETRAGKHSRIFESHLKSDNGTDRWISSTLTPIFDDNQTLRKLLFVDTDITESKKMGNLIVASLKEKDLLLKEIHHRVKNNLQIIISLLNLQSGYIKDEETLKAVREGQNRVRSMALVHEKFYQSEELGEINFQEYTEKLCHFLKQSYAGQDAPIAIHVDAEGIGFDMDTAMPCGLLITEIVSNSLKYGFPNHRQGEINIEFRKVPEKKMMMTIADNGIGLPNGFDIEKSESLGMQLIIALTSQLDGELKFSGESGTRFSITFTYPKG
ncbi:MAG: histidine kinase dimerization/phosphoacceptor domain -containing protein [Bacteroidota bacterium]